MDGGLVVQMGTHAQLMADRDGLCIDAGSCARQFGEPGRFPPGPAVRGESADQWWQRAYQAVETYVGSPTRIKNRANAWDRCSRYGGKS